MLVCAPQLPDESAGSVYEGAPLRLSYHMHEYYNGEHYNSVREKKAPAPDPCSADLK